MLPHQAPNPALLDRRELDAARLDLLRRRFVWFATVIGLLTIGFAAAAFALGAAGQTAPITPAARRGLIAMAIAGLVMIAVPRLRSRSIRTTSLRNLLRRTTALVLLVLVSQAAAAQIIAHWVTRLLGPFGFQGSVGPAFPLIVMTGLAHTAAALIVPWRVRDAVVPIAILTSIVLVAGAIEHGGFGDMTLPALVLCLAAGLPGIAISWFRSSSFRDRVAISLLSGRYTDLQRDLAWARRIHERLFPAPISGGPLSVDFRYEPAMQIGGDYLEVVAAPPESGGVLTAILVDVTGHGVAAALTVNRLHGEIKRAFAADADARPAAVIRALNDYMALTLSDERVFATALVLRLDPRAGTLHWASAGHPPALLRRASGAIERLDSTAMMLGVLPPGALDVEERSAKLVPGELLVAYTDGAVECADELSRQLTVEGFERLVADLPAGCATPRAVESLASAVAAHRDGPPEDDTLILAAAVAPR